MDKLIITGPNKLKGDVKISGSKNSSLPILCATLLTPKKVQLSNVPDLADVNTLIKLLKKLGAHIEPIKTNQYYIRTQNIKSSVATYSLVKTMRASILVLGPLLARAKKAQVSLPGGCAIGSRPIDIHLEGLKKLGAKIKISGGYVEASAPKLVGATINLPFPSVGATENIMMAACYAHGTTTIQNAAREPEVIDLGLFLRSLGADIDGLGSSVITINGPIQEFKESTYSIIPDRIEAATFIIAALITNSRIKVKKINIEHLEYILDTLENMGASFERSKDEIIVKKHKGLQGTSVKTAPYPGFPTDLQAQIMSLALTAQSPTIIQEDIFENRFMHIPELKRMGADIQQDKHIAVVKKSHKLTAAPVMCTDLRASASLVLASLISNGKTEIQRIYHLDRGYEKIDKKLKKLGIKVKRIKN